jgi:ABC-type phosphate transport system substrate-binding protein
MKTMFAISAVFVAALVIFAVPSTAQLDNSEYVIVSNKDVQGSSIRISDLKGIFLREIRTWGNDGTKIIPVDLASANSFYQNLFGKSHVQMQAYWLNMRIKYNAELPVSKKDPESAKEFISENKGAIGFLRNSDLDNRVKVLKLVN